ncbi:zf-HC2 domain-containing protein [Streptomyces sp. NPDC001922]|uniref:zf-HC2 domain-containing protein n=1 Tax=Streptomyces sp. NPDC001922 TaxID=3364624 RepID=UPI0036C34AB2
MNRRAADWHVPPEHARTYAAGTLPETEAWSLEKHVESCTGCAARVSDAVRAGTAGPVLAEVREALLTTVVAEASGGAAAAGRRHRGALGRIGWAAGPALRGPWLASLLFTAAVAVTTAHLAGYTGARPLLLALAPVLPLAGVAASYGRSSDPLHELIAATPSGGLRLLLTRTAAVLAVSVPLLTLTGLLLPGAPGVPGAAAWLLPGLALTLAALALGSLTGCRNAAAGIGSGWLLAVAGHALAARPGGDGIAAPPADALTETLNSAFSGAVAQGSWAAAAAVCAGLLVLRRASFDHLERP